jgi:hypothetical protein
LLIIVLTVLLALTAVRYVSFFRIKELKIWVLPLAFLIKIGIGILFNLLHQYTYGFGDLSHDGGTFILEANRLNAVFFESPLTYFKFLTGIGESPELVKQFLPKTVYWSTGDLTLINDSKNVIRIHSLIHFFSNNEMYVHVTVMCLISLFAVKNFFISFKPYISFSPVLFFWIVLLIPSTIFWTSSVLKEPMLFLGISLFVRGIMYETLLKKQFIVTAVGLLLLLSFKPYVLLFLLLSLFFYLCYRFVFRYNLFYTLSSIIVLFTLFAYLFAEQRKVVVNYLTRKQFDFVNVGKGGLHVATDDYFYYFQPYQYKNLAIGKDSVELIRPSEAYIMRFGSTKQPVKVFLTPSGEKWKIYYYTLGCLSFIKTTPIHNSAWQLIKNIPEAILNSTLRPYYSDAGSNLKWLSMIEVWGIILFLFLAVIYRRKLSNNEKAMVYSLLLFAVFLLLLIGWTTPVLGAIARYRFPAQLALIITGLILIDLEKMKQWKNIF